MIDPQCTLRSFGVPLDGPLWMFGDNNSVITRSTIPHSTLGKRWNALLCHRVREAVAGGWVHFEHIPGTENPADILMKPLPWFSLKIFVEPLLLWKGDTVDAPSGTSNPEGSDAGPGSTVPDEQLSHGHDSANVSGHAVPAVPHGNQFAALFDAEPADNEFLHGVWTVTTFDFTRIWMDFAFARLPT